MRINGNIAKVMVLGKENKGISVEINREKIEQVNLFKNTGMLMDREGRTEAEVVKGLLRLKIIS